MEEKRYRHVNGMTFDSFKEACNYWIENEFDDLFEEIDEEIDIEKVLGEIKEEKDCPDCKELKRICANHE